MGLLNKLGIGTGSAPAAMCRGRPPPRPPRVISAVAVPLLRWLASRSEASETNRVSNGLKEFCGIWMASGGARCLILDRPGKPL